MGGGNLTGALVTLGMGVVGIAALYQLGKNKSSLAKVGGNVTTTTVKSLFKA